MNWPDLRLDRVPDSAETEQLALAVRAGAGLGESERVDFHPILERGGFVLRHVSFAGLGPLGGLHSRRGDEAALICERDHFKILVNADATHGGPESRLSATARQVGRRRFRFRVAHELGHSFFYDRSVTPISRTVPASRGEEDFCDYFGGSLLVSPSLVEATEPTPAGLLRLADECDASLQVTARRLAKRSDVDAIVGLTLRVNPRTGSEMEWRTNWSAGAFVPRHARLRSEAVVVAGSLGSGTAIEPLSVGRLKGMFAVVAQHIGSQVVAVVRRVGDREGAPDEAGPRQLRLL